MKNMTAANVDTFKHFGIAFLAILLISSINSIENLISTLGYYVIVLWLSWQLTKLYRNYNTNIPSVESDRKAVLITGCDTGFGNKLAEQLDAKGFVVFASCLDPESKGAQHLVNNCSKRLKVFKLDVTKEEDVREALHFVNNNLQNNKLWALVNNAGVLHFLPFEWGPEGIDIFTKQLDVNVLGVIRVTKAFLPLLRKSKDSRIVNMGSLSGRLSFPGVASYSMTKASLKTLNDSLRNEVKPFGINVILVEPTVYSTELTDYNRWIDDFQTKWKETPEDVRRDYGPEMCDVLHERINSVIFTAKENFQEVIDANIDAITSCAPKPYYYIYSLLERAMFSIQELLAPEFFDVIISERVYFPVVKLLRNKNRI